MGVGCNVMEAMRPSNLLIVSTALLSVSAYSQQSDMKIVQSARARYYNLSAKGFQSLKCSVKFDLSTVPLPPSATDDSMRKLLEATMFTLIWMTRVVQPCASLSFRCQ